MSKSNVHFYIGTWECSSGDSSLRIIVQSVSTKPVIEAFDASDGERLEVMNCRLTLKGIRFRLRVPSTNYVTENLLAKSEQGMSLSYTITEDWRKVTEKGDNGMTQS